MTFVLTPRIERIAAVLLLVCVTVITLVSLLDPLARMAKAEREQRRLLRKEYAALQGLITTEPQLRETLARIDGNPIWQRLYQEGDAEAEADLQKDFRVLADAQGISVGNLQPLNPAPGEAFTGVTLRVGFNTTIDHLAQLLAAMQAGTHFMRFENLYVTAPMSQSGGSNPVLVVRGDVLSYNASPDTPRP